MDILDSVKSVLGGNEGDKKNDLMSSVLGLVGGQGGIGNLVQKFTSNGLGDVVSSWVGKGENQPVSQEQIQNVLGPEKINEISSKTGMDNNAVTGQLSKLLPQVVDKLTPDGKVPEGDILSQGKDLLGGLFGK